MFLKFEHSCQSAMPSQFRAASLETSFQNVSVFYFLTAFRHKFIPKPPLPTLARASPKPHAWRILHAASLMRNKQTQKQTLAVESNGATISPPVPEVPRPLYSKSALMRNKQTETFTVRFNGTALLSLTPEVPTSQHRDVGTTSSLKGDAFPFGMCETS